MTDPVEEIARRHARDLAEKIVCFHPAHPDSAVYNDRGTLLALLAAERQKSTKETYGH